MRAASPGVTSPGVTNTEAPPSSPPLARTPTSRIKKERRLGGRSETHRLNTSHSLSVLPLAARTQDTEECSMVPERDTGTEPPPPLIPPVTQPGIEILTSG